MGRDAEVAALTEAVSDAERGVGRIVLLSGEAGIGKSRLATEVLAVARRRELTTLEGRANPLHTGLAYAPIVEALRCHLGRLSDADFVELLDGLDDLGRLLADPRLPPAAALHDPALEKTRMFDAAARLLHRLADTAPVLLFLDDLHWADLGSIELVHYLSRGIGARRVLLLATYRTGEVGGPLRDLAVSVRRGGRDAELNLAPLPDSAVAAMVSDLLNEDPAPDLLRSVTARARGVPLFVTALLHGGPMPPNQLPVIIRDLVLDVLRRLDESERRLLELVSVAGDTASDEVIRAVWDLSDVDVQTVLRRSVADGLIVEEVGRTVTYRVGHPLYAEVAYAELTAAERRAVHAALAEAIDRLDPDDVLALAPHYLGAGDLVSPDRAGDVLAEAGWRALGVHADDEAVRYLAASASEARAANRIELLPALLEGVGLAHQRVGQLNEAVEVWAEGLAVARQCGREDVTGALCTRLALVEEEWGNSPGHIERPDEPAGLEDTVLRLTSAIRRWDEVRVRTLAGGLARFSAGPAPSVQAANNLGQAIIAMVDNDFAAAGRSARLALAAGELCEEETPVLAGLACRQLIGLSILEGQLPAALSFATIHRVKVRRVEHPTAPADAQFCLAIAYYLDGNRRAAMDAIDSGLRLSRRAQLPRAVHYLLLGRAFLLAEQGRSAAAEYDLAEAIGFPADDSLDALIEMVRTSLALQAGEPDRVPARTEWALYYEPMVMSVGMLFGGLAAIGAGDDRRAADIARQMRTTGSPFLGALADRLTGLVAGDAELVRSAAERLAAMGFPVLTAQTRLEWAELAGADDARAAVGECLPVFERAGLNPWADRCRRLARSLGIRVTAGRTAGVLSKREGQIAQLVADGLANAEIASRLFLSERTVETHLRNSYAKLGLGSRVALARWVTENGID